MPTLSWLTTFGRILSELRNMFDYIVVDSNGNLDDINLEYSTSPKRSLW